jgi:NAD(P)-dependent dehydrogenase (short-subunit alcohol dehydrogenase family)
MAGVLVVTGGGRGIGAATCLAAARRGYRVCVNYQSNRARADQVVEAIRAAGGEAIAVAADVADEAAIVRLFETVDRELGRLTGLVNSAGVAGPVGRIDACDAAALRALFDANVVGTMLCCREAVQRMSTRHGGGGGAIVNIGSRLSTLGGGGEMVPYAASKAAIDTFTIGLAQEVAAEGIRVTAVSPGLIDTEIQPPGRVERVGPTLPMKRPGRPEEVAEAILWLLSDSASYVAGAILGVSGAR